MELADGSSTTRRQLDRIEDFDPRSKGYPLAGPLGAVSSAERPVNRWWRVGRRLDQGQQGACVGFAFTHDLVGMPAPWDFREQTGLADQTAAAEAFAVKTYHAAQKIDQWPGGEYPGASRRMSGTSILAGAKTLRRAGYFDSYHWAFGVDELAVAVSRVGPCIIGCRWLAGMETPDRYGYIKPTGRSVGGHAILVNGVSVGREEFWLTNSWGRGWGLYGYCRVTFEDMDQMLRVGGEACVPTGRAEQKAN